MHLAHREVVEIKRQPRRAVAIGMLLLWQADVEPDRWSARFGRAAAGRLHDPRPSASGDHVIAVPACVIDGPTPLGNDAPEPPGLLIVGGLLQTQSCEIELPRSLGGLQTGPGLLARDHPGAAEDDDRGADAGIPESELSLFILEPEAHTPQLVTQQELGIHGRQDETVRLLCGKRDRIDRPSAGRCDGCRAARFHANFHPWLPCRPRHLRRMAEPGQSPSTCREFRTTAACPSPYQKRPQKASPMARASHHRHDYCMPAPICSLRRATYSLSSSLISGAMGGST